MDRLADMKHRPQHEDGQPQPPLACQPFEHSKQEAQHGVLSFLGVKQKSPPQTQRTESEAGWDRPCDGHRQQAGMVACPRSPGVLAVPYGVIDTRGRYSIVDTPMFTYGLLTPSI